MPNFTTDQLFPSTVSCGKTKKLNKMDDEFMR